MCNHRQLVPREACSVQVASLLYTADPANLGVVQLTRTLELQPLSHQEILCLQSNPPLLLPSGFTVTLARGTIQVLHLVQG